MRTPARPKCWTDSSQRATLLWHRLHRHGVGRGAVVKLPGKRDRCPAHLLRHRPRCTAACPRRRRSAPMQTVPATPPLTKPTAPPAPAWPPCRAARQAHTPSMPGQTGRRCSLEPATHQDRHLTVEQCRILTSVYNRASSRLRNEYMARYHYLGYTPMSGSQKPWNVPAGGRRHAVWGRFSSDSESDFESESECESGSESESDSETSFESKECTTEGSTLHLMLDGPRSRAVKHLVSVGADHHQSRPNPSSGAAGRPKSRQVTVGATAGTFPVGPARTVEASISRRRRVARVSTCSLDVSQTERAIGGVESRPGMSTNASPDTGKFVLHRHTLRRDPTAKARRNLPCFDWATREERETVERSPTPTTTAPHLSVRGRWRGGFARHYLGWLMGSELAT